MEKRVYEIENMGTSMLIMFLGWYFKSLSSELKI